MTEELRKYEESIKTKHKFGWTPEFTEIIKTELNVVTFFPIVIQTFELLEWKIVYRDESSISAIRENEFGSLTEKINVSHRVDKITIKSISLSNDFWDLGRNSKRVKLFIYAFVQTFSSYDEISLKDLEEKTIKEINGDNYEIPETLPIPPKYKKSNSLTAYSIGISGSLVIGFTVAIISYYWTYFIGIFEVGIGFAIGFIISIAIKSSNYTNSQKIHYLLILMILLIFCTNHYFYYVFIKSSYNLSFLEFMKLKFEAGLKIDSLNVGSIGLVLSWLFQIIFGYGIGYIRVFAALTEYQIGKVPVEVLDFAYYNLMKDESIENVRMKLSDKGWNRVEDQNYVFEAIDAIYEINQSNK